MRLSIHLWVVSLLILTFSCAPKIAPTAAAADAAPDFPAGLDWLNVDQPLTMKDLHGKVVVLDFWTFCCINCMHVIPDLKRLEAKYGDALVVVGVHSAKFATEHGTDNIRAAVLRYEVTHPIVNDANFDVWNSYGVGAWPSFVLIDPDGKAVAAHSGEGPYDAFDQKIGDLIKTFDAQKKIDRTPLKLHLEKDKAPPTPLKFPGKLTADPTGSLLYVSDSNHNRIVVLKTADGSVADVIGDGTAGLKDGSWKDARFFRPQGVALDGHVLYVADTENHAVRKVDLDARTVTTLAGTGHQAQQFNASGHGTDIDLSSPWDVLVHKGKLYVAMAGMHQIWTIDLTTDDAAPFAGSGRENIAPGALLDAALAQPSGLTTDGTHLYSADSESSSIRMIDFDPNGVVSDLAGHGLFDFGDRDGAANQALLQHPLGVAYHEGAIYIADTYNNKIKKLDAASNQITTLIGTGIAGSADGPALQAQLNEPSGLTFANGRLYITDTNNHLIRVYDPKTNAVSTLTITNTDKLMPLQRPADSIFKGHIVDLPEQQVAPSTGSVDITVKIPDGYQLNAAAPFYVGISSDDPKIVTVGDDVAARNVVNPTFPLQTPAAFTMGKTKLTVDLVVYYCEAAQESVCKVTQIRYVIPVSVGIGANSTAVMVHATVGSGQH